MICRIKEAFSYRAEVLSEHFVVKAIRNDTLILLAEVVRKEVAYVHYRNVVFSGEPASSLAYLITSDVTAVPSRCLSPRAVVLPKTVFEEGPISLPVRADGRFFEVGLSQATEQTLGVDDTQ